MRAKAVGSWALLARTAKWNIRVCQSPTWLSLLQPFLPGPLRSHSHAGPEVSITKQLSRCTNERPKPTAGSNPRTKREAFNSVRTGPLHFSLIFNSPHLGNKRVCCWGSTVSWALSEFYLVFLFLSVYPTTPIPPSLLQTLINPNQFISPGVTTPLQSMLLGRVFLSLLIDVNENTCCRGC